MAFSMIGWTVDNFGKIRSPEPDTKTTAMQSRRRRDDDFSSHLGRFCNLHFGVTQQHRLGPIFYHQHLETAKTDARSATKTE